jgi:hypothetical protein
MICKECKEQKDSCEFYFIDGGLGYSQEKMNICKICVQKYNKNRKINKYLDTQIKAQFYGAKAVINGENITLIAQKIDNGISKNSNQMGIQNFLYLFGFKGLNNVSKQIKRIYEEMKQTNK